jgi:hypothetical protein
VRDLNAGKAHEPVSEDIHLSEKTTHTLVCFKIYGNGYGHWDDSEVGKRGNHIIRICELSS